MNPSSTTATLVELGLRSSGTAPPVTERTKSWDWTRIVSAFAGREWTWTHIKLNMRDFAPAVGSPPLSICFGLGHADEHPCIVNVGPIMHARQKSVRRVVEVFRI
jgi:hypothetical protein